MWQAIIFDFDGVICESVDVKTQAFAKLFADYPRHLNQILDYHMANGGLSRFEKFKVIYRDFLKKDLTEKESERLGKRFTEYSFEAVVNAPLVKGAREFLDTFHRKFSFFIASGTPEEEMVSVVKAKRLDGYFKGVYGSPMTKGELIKGILKNHVIENNMAVFVGDSINDFQGAQAARIEFIGRVHRDYPSPFAQLNVKALISDLGELADLLNKGRC